MKIETVADKLKRAFANFTAFAPDPVYQCPKCKDFGYEEKTAVNGHTYMVKCECAIRKAYQRICKQAGFPLAEAKTLSDYKIWDDTTRLAKMKAEEYIRDFDTIRQQWRNWFLMFGQSGAGKTMIGRAIVKALIERQGKPVRARAVKFYEMMQRLKAQSNDTDYWNILAVYTDCELLFIDDLLKEKMVHGDLNEPDTKHLFAVLDRRYEAKRPTIITSECTSGRLDALDTAMYGRMTERAYAEIIFSGRESNYRKRA